MRPRGWIREETEKGQRLGAFPRTRRKERKRLEETAKPCLSSTDHWLATKFLYWFDPLLSAHCSTFALLPVWNPCHSSAHAKTARALADTSPPTSPIFIIIYSKNPVLPANNLPSVCHGKRPLLFPSPGTVLP